MNELSDILAQAAADAEQVRAEAIDVKQEEAEGKAARRRHVHSIPKMFFTWREAAWVSGIGMRTLQRFAKEGQLRICRIGGVTRIRREDLDQLAIDHMVTDDDDNGPNIQQSV